MKCIPELYKQLKTLVNTISQCNYIAYYQKDDIVQDTLEKLLIKYNKNTLEDDFDKIKGYSFMVLRNYCSSNNKRDKVIYTDNLFNYDNIPVDETYEEHYNIENLHKVINNHIQHPKYTEEHKEVCQLLMQNKYDDEINEIMNLEPGKLPKLKFTIKHKMKIDVKRPLKYIIKNKFDETINVPCYKRTDILKYFGDEFNRKNLTSMINLDFMNYNGYYILKQFKKENE